MPPVELCQYRSRLEVKSGEEIGRPAAFVVVGSSLRGSRAHRQEGLRAIQGLNLGLLIHAQHQRTVWRIQVKAYDVAHLLDELRIGGQLESLTAMGLQTEGSPNAADRALGQPRPLSERSRAPMRSVRRRGLQRQCQHPLDSGIRYATRRAWTRLVEQSSQPVTDKPLPPFAHRLMSDPKLRRHTLVRFILRTRQDDPRPQGQSLRRLPAARPLA